MPETLVDEPEEQVRERKRFHHRLAISILRFVVVVAIAATIGGSWYLAKKGFGQTTRARVAEELKKRGVEASIQQLTLNPFRGLVAHNVRVSQYGKPANVLAEVSEIALDVNFAAFFRGQSFINAVDIRDATLTVPMERSDMNAPKAELRKVRAHIYFPPERIEVTQADGFFGGVRISVTGSLIKRGDYLPTYEVGDEEWRKRKELILRVAKELSLCDFGGTHPSLQIKFGGDVADLENAQVEAQLRADHIKRSGYEARALNVAAAFREQTLNLTDFTWQDSLGTIVAHGTGSRPNGTAEFSAHSNIDVRAFLQAIGYGDALVDLQYSAAPNIELSGTAKLTPEKFQMQVIGRANLAAFAYKKISFLTGAAQFSWDGDRTFVHDVHLQHETGTVDGEILNAPDDFRAQIRSAINPAAFRPALSPKDQQFLSEWEFPKPPNVQLTIHGTSAQSDTWRGEGTVALSRARFRGAWMNSGSAKVQFGDRAVTYSDMKIVRDEGVATGAFAYDFGKREVRITNVKSSVRPTEAIVWVDPKMVKAVTPYKFHGPPNVTAAGVYKLDGAKGTHIDVNVDAASGLDYVFIGKTLNLQRASAKLIFTDDHLEIAQGEGALLGGTVRGNADISLGKGDQPYRAHIAADAINFPQLTKLYFDYTSAQGDMNGHFNFSGVGDNARAIDGEGRVVVRDGDVFAIPVMGPLSGILNTLFAGHTGYSVARKASADFTMKDGVIHTDDADVAGKLFRMRGEGDIHFLDDQLDMDVRVEPGGPAVLLTPVYKLFEYKGEGSLKDPNWHPKHF